MTIPRKFIAVATSITWALSLISAPNASALPSPFEIELKAATKVAFGKPIPMAVPSCKYSVKKNKYVSNCTYEKFIVTINSFKFARKDSPVGVEVPVYAIDMKLENYSKKIDSGLNVGSLLRCKNEKSTYSPFYSDSIDPQLIPAGSELSGVVFSSLPDDMSAEACLLPTLWISLTGTSVDMKDKASVAEVKKKKLVSRAYIPLTPELLAGN